VKDKVALLDVIRHIRENVLPWCPAGQFFGIVTTVWKLEEELKRP
jgi:hypothetical protein